MTDDEMGEEESQEPQYHAQVQGGGKRCKCA